MTLTPEQFERKVDQVQEDRELGRKFQAAAIALNDLRNALCRKRKLYESVNRMESRLGVLRRELGV